jgi:hypothetical protein
LSAWVRITSPATCTVRDDEWHDQHDRAVERDDCRQQRAEAADERIEREVVAARWAREGDGGVVGEPGVRPRRLRD